MPGFGRVWSCIMFTLHTHCVKNLEGCRNSFCLAKSGTVGKSNNLRRTSVFLYLKNYVFIFSNLNTRKHSGLWKWAGDVYFMRRHGGKKADCFSLFPIGWLIFRADFFIFMGLHAATSGDTAKIVSIVFTFYLDISEMSPLWPLPTRSEGSPILYHLMPFKFACSSNMSTLHMLLHYFAKLMSVLPIFKFEALYGLSRWSHAKRYNYSKPTESAQSNKNSSCRLTSFLASEIFAYLTDGKLHKLRKQILLPNNNPSFAVTTMPNKETAVLINSPSKVGRVHFFHRKIHTYSTAHTYVSVSWYFE